MNINERVQLIDIVELGKEHGKDVEESYTGIESVVLPQGVPDVVSNEESCASSPAKKIGDPRKCQTKGRKSDKEKEMAEGNSRCKSGIEMQRKPRRCKCCDATGHDARNCPTKKAEQEKAITDIGMTLHGLTRSLKSYVFKSAVSSSNC
ncbi:hypothetical protein MKW94_030252 [Papaver nudicaule]|uniref:CCHC-type domain-containing protein n=1 Tax=Papaver nudicaule TaxID=74823 RepID=A0AA41VAB9_PAPNU|nr:hypothetical protein [Papaver nudicaule]